MSLQRRVRRRRGDQKRPSWQKSQHPRDAVLLEPPDTSEWWLPLLTSQREMLKGMRFGPEDLARLGLR